MSLSKDILAREILSAFQNVLKLKESSSAGVTHPKAADVLSSAYHNYVNIGQPTAGGLKTVTQPSREVLTPFLVAPSLSGFVNGLVAYWSPVTWTAPGFSPANPTIVIPSPSMASDLVNIFQIAVQNKSSTLDISDRIASVLHTYTMSIAVTATTTSVPPTTSTLFIM